MLIKLRILSTACLVCGAIGYGPTAGTAEPALERRGDSDWFRLVVTDNPSPFLDRWLDTNETSPPNFSVMQCSDRTELGVFVLITKDKIRPDRSWQVVLTVADPDGYIIQTQDWTMPIQTNPPAEADYALYPAYLVLSGQDTRKLGEYSAKALIRQRNEDMAFGVEQHFVVVSRRARPN